jgi:sialic acid synthase SpsE
MDKITIFNEEGYKIPKNEMNPIVRLIYDIANSIAYSLSFNYKKQNQRIEIVFDENSGDYNIRFYKCTEKYGRDFEKLFMQKVKRK